MSRAPPSATESFRVVMTISGDDAPKVRAFMEREGLPTPAAAVRAMALSALDANPGLGLGREERARIARETRTALLSGVHRLMAQVAAELEQELAGARNVDATREKEQVIFRREDQE